MKTSLAIDLVQELLIHNIPPTAGGGEETFSSFRLRYGSGDAPQSNGDLSAAGKRINTFHNSAKSKIHQ